MEVKDKLKRSHSLHNRTLNYSEAKSLYRRSNSVSELVARYENVRQNTLRKSQTSEQTGVGRILPERTSLLKWAEEYEKPRGALFQTNSFLGDDNGDKKEKRKSEPKIDKSKERAASGSWQAEDLCRGTARMKLTAGAERHQYEALLSPTNQRSQIRGEFHQAQNSFIPSVKQRSELFLSKAAAAESQARNPKLKFGKETDIYTSPQKKMAENMMKFSPKDAEKKAEVVLPPPPPLDSTQPSEGPGSQEQSFMPLPPPKESFSKFYEQRQVNELKRLYRHMHPELRKNLEHTVTCDMTKLLQTDEPTQQAAINQDTGLPGEVQSMRWIFENWNLDAIGEHQGSKKLVDEEGVLGGNVKDTSMFFKGQPSEGGLPESLPGKDQTKGDVKTALWLFETQSLDSMNKIYPEDTEVQEAILKEPVERGDVKSTKHLFETCSLSEVGRCNSVEENSILQLKSEIQELKGDVRKTVKLFQTEPLCAIRDDNGNIHEIKSICREDTEADNVNRTRWLFETQPLDSIHKNSPKVQIIRGISLEELEKGGVNAKKWIFETQPLDTIKENNEEGMFQASLDSHEGADSSSFENRECSGNINCTDKVLPGDVKSTLWLFESQPMETLKGNFEVGPLKKVEMLNEEKGDVKQRKHLFETCSLDKISDKDEEAVRNVTEISKGDVTTFKNLFETLPLESFEKTSNVTVSDQEDIQVGNVKANQTLFETVPLYAIEDSLGNFHEVTSISREQVESADVRNYKWMFETKPLDQFNESPQKVDIIRGITKEEIVSGDVGTAKWLFETQPVDIVHQQSDATEKHSSVQKQVLQKGDVKKCKWLFETQPIDKLYDKSEQTKDTEAQVQGDVKSYTWMFESQPLDSFKDSEEQYINVKTTLQDACKGVDVKTSKHLFETEPIENISSKGEFRKIIRYSSTVQMPSGEVSRVKEIFEATPDKGIGGKGADIPVEENIQKGSVNKFTWLFENRPLDSMSASTNGFQEVPPEKDVQGGDVVGKRFVFETYSLDQIKQEADETEIKKVQESVTRGDVKSCMMLFETNPLYAIQDKGGEYHEVTSVKKEEVLKGDVRGAKWLFETKPLDKINKDEEVFVIRAVTQEDIDKGSVTAARWRFETEPLDSVTEKNKYTGKELEDVQKGDVQLNKQLFESQQLNQKKYVRLVSVSDVQKGNVRTSTWLFENQPIDSLKGDSDEHPGIVTVQREDNQRGDVKRCTWLFESQPLDSLKDTDIPTAQGQEEIPQANVKSTTWLFESTPLDKFERATSFEQTEVNVKDTLEKCLSYKIIEHKGIAIESVDERSVKMVKYQPTHAGTLIQKEETLGGNLQRILLQLLHRADLEQHGMLVEENNMGELHRTNLQLIQREGQEEDRQVQDNVSKALQILLNEDVLVKTGIIMEETEKGSVRIIIYSVSKYIQRDTSGESIVKGDVKSTIGNLLHNQERERKVSVTREQHERGNVQLYTSCIEKGDLGYLRSLQDESEIEALMLSQSEDAKASTEQAKKFSEKDGSVQVAEGQRSTIKGKESMCTTSNPAIHCMDPGAKGMKCCVAADGTPLKPTEMARNQCILETNVTKNEEKEDNCARQTTSTLPPEGASSRDLHAALLDLRQATAEAKTIQKQVECKFQKSTQEVQSCSEQIKGKVVVQSMLPCQTVATTMHSSRSSTSVHEARRSEASFQATTASTKKVSVQEKEEQVLPLLETGQERKVIVSTESSIMDGVDSPKKAKSYLNPFLHSDYMTEPVQADREQDIVRGDVKATIKALQSASSEQRDVEKEEVVRGNLATALQSLERSNVNVSKGDFKTAMIYRNAGLSHTVSKVNTEDQQIRCQASVKLVPPSDNDFPPPPAAVIEQEHCLPSKIEAKRDDTMEVQEPAPIFMDSAANKASDTILDENANTLATPQPLMTQRKKPVPPPKPKHLLPGACPPPHLRAKCQTKSTSSQNSRSTNDCSSKITISKMTNEQWQQQFPSESAYASANRKEQESEMFACTANEQLKPELCLNNNCESSEISTSKNDHGQANDFHTQIQPLENLVTDTMSQGVKTETMYCQNSETHNVTRSKKGVTLIEPTPSLHHSENQEVVMRVKRKTETEDEKRKRLSIHMDEILRGNVRASMDILENMRKQDELERILNKVKELEDETSTVDARSVQGLFESVPDWVVDSEDEPNSTLKGKDDEKDVILELLRDDTESVSSVELAFEDLEKASTEIKYLKEQTLARLLDIEETIKKALYSVSSLKSESDIAGLTGLFRESLGSPSPAPCNNIRKISIVSSKAKPEKPVHLSVQKPTEAFTSQDVTETKKTELNTSNVPSRAISPASPSFITIESAARKPQQNTSCASSPPKPKALNNGQTPEDSLSKRPYSPQEATSQNSPLNPQRQKSILELKTGPEGPKLIGTTVVTEKYEECDQFGNKLVRSKTSTTVTKQSDTQSSSTYEVVTALPRYEVTASPRLKRHVENSHVRGNETGVVFVTFGNSKPAKK
ncbi:xin actin-binding repeat-containing protein 1 isoform X1 [Xenopus tropicalis]|uniref:Xin actin binding repeat containing 1 n=2 Tax=Xenopus tropicalis TaxID=8364 RepID=A0A803JCV9_XENTR|nr:xin actin-binding repeat-containing protein 1 isoform X1 [Xenopus tropicalis]